MKTTSTHSFHRFVLTGIIAALAAVSSAAQTNSYTNMLNVTMNASNSLFNAQSAVNNQRSQLQQAINQSNGQQYGGVQGMQGRQLPISATDFRPVQAPIMPDQFANSYTSTNPQMRQEMRGLFQQMLANYTNAGGRPNNLGGAFSWISCIALQIRTGKPIRPPVTDQILAYFNNTLGPSPEYAMLTPMKQQMLYESLIITAGIMFFLDQQGRQQNNPQAIAQAKQMSDTVLKSYLGIN